MYPSVYDLKEFYASKRGREVRRVLGRRIRDMFPDVHGFRVMGFGYAVPYLSGFLEESDRSFGVMLAGGGVHVWPEYGDNVVCLAEGYGVPFETNSVDRIIVVHGVEFWDSDMLAEIGRVLKSNGRMILIVPNRGGFWARRDRTPFGQGAVYSLAQVKRLLRHYGFVYERNLGALYLPPTFAFIKSLQWFERFGQRFLPFGAGVHIVEVSKQMYADARPSGGSKVGVATVMPRPVVEGISQKDID